MNKYKKENIILKFKIFVDGKEGTTGLMINKRLKKRTDIEILNIDLEKRKDIKERKKLINESDITFLCLPDLAAIESFKLVENNNTKIIDASTAHRTNENWVYGLPELNKNQREKIKSSNKISNPGCHATGFITLIYPLLKQKIINNDYPISCTSITGYSGGGKKLISKFENKEFNSINSPKHYALNLKHKHLAEMKKITALKNEPLFSPIIGNFYKGMVVSVPLYVDLFNKKISAKNLHEIFLEYYQNEYFININPFDSEENLEKGFLDAEKNNDTNNLDIFIYGHERQIILLARFDNLGKGASGAAVQNMNILMGVKENTSL
jgi:N-acetyl-gamma-glutamyl-phosphate reductase